MVLTEEDVEKIASLARLELTRAEKTLYQQQLSAVLAYAARLNELDIEHVAPTTSAVVQNNVMREDKVEPSLSLDDVLFNAPAQSLDQFQIQSVLDEE
jgi:aspartyl-tRNA(Asn)/glutamyl-tRNA(Gln) amidotransferase subunit C